MSNHIGDANKMVAAPVAAAPVDGLHLAVIGRAHFGNPIPQEWYAAARELLASTPAAPGIDLRNALLQLREDALHMKDPGDTVNAYDRVLRLIDPSPKGGIDAPGIDLRAPCTEAVYVLARKLLWIAYVWNDHNFDHPYKIARKLAEEFGIESFDQANAWLDEQAKLIDASPKGGSEPVATLTIGEAGEEGTQPYFLDRIRETEAFGNLKPGTYHLAVCSMQATSAEAGA